MGAVTGCIYTVYKSDVDLHPNTAAAAFVFFLHPHEKHFITGNFKICTSVLCSDSNTERQRGRVDDGIIIQ